MPLSISIAILGDRAHLPIDFSFGSVVTGEVAHRLIDARLISIRVGNHGLGLSGNGTSPKKFSALAVDPSQSAMVSRCVTHAYV
jgi:alpha/beta superfamily hydrolase